MPCVNVAHHRRAKASYKAARNEKVKTRRQTKHANREAKRLEKETKRQAKLANKAAKIEAKQANKVAKEAVRTAKASVRAAKKSARLARKTDKAAKAAPETLVENKEPVVTPAKTPETQKVKPINPDDPQLLQDGAYIQIQPRGLVKRRVAKSATKTAPTTTSATKTTSQPASTSAVQGASVAQDLTSKAPNPASTTQTTAAQNTSQSQATPAQSAAQTQTTSARKSRYSKQPNLRTELKRSAKRQAKLAKRQTKQALKAQQKAIKQQAKTAKLQLKVAKQQAKQLGYLPVAAPAVRLNLGTKQLRRRPSRAELINAESRLGSTLFGPIPAGHRREFFHDQQNVWIWHEGWVDQGRHARQLTVRYEVRPTGVYKKVSSGSYLKLEGHELENFRRATHAYLSLIKRNIYRYAPTTPPQVA